jgi:Na+/H+ antiporter NhaD/arsenite permease-like protein
MYRGIRWVPWAILLGAILLAAVACIGYYVGEAILIPLACVAVVGAACVWAVQSSQRGRRMR